MRTCPTDPWLSVSVICVADPLLSISVRHRSRLERGGRRNHGEMLRGDAKGGCRSGRFGLT